MSRFLDSYRLTTNAVIPVFNTNPDGTTNSALLMATPGVVGVPGVTTIDPTALNILNLKSNIYSGTFLIPRGTSQKPPGTWAVTAP